MIAGGGGRKFHKKLPGFSLLEVLISVSLFIIIVISSTEIFRLTLEGQKTISANQNVQSSLKYFYEVISKELRMAVKTNIEECGVSKGSLYEISDQVYGYGQKLEFKNYHNECVIYEIDVDPDTDAKRFKITRSNPQNLQETYSGFLSPSRIDIQDLQFFINNDGNVSDNKQTSITINMTAQARIGDERDSIMNIQTTITSRYYK